MQKIRDQTTVKPSQKKNQARRISEGDKQNLIPLRAAYHDVAYLVSTLLISLNSEMGGTVKTVRLDVVEVWFLKEMSKGQSYTPYTHKEAFH